MAVEVDYYAILGVSRDASRDDVEAAVRKALHEWRKRTEAADLSVRQEGQGQGHRAGAHGAALDSGRRASYDRDLAGGVKTAAAPAGQTRSGTSWADQAEAYLALGDYSSAAYAAREATQGEGTNARTWWIRSRANAGLQVWQDALSEAKQATQLEDSNGEYHFNLALVYEQTNRSDEAISEYRRASACDPANPMYELAVGGVYAATGRPDQALLLVEAVYTNRVIGGIQGLRAEQLPTST